MKIRFSSPSVPKSGSLVLSVAKDAKLGTFGAALDEQTGGQIKRAMKSAEFKAKRDAALELVAPPGVSLDRIVLLGLGAPKELSAYDLEKLGGSIAGRLSGSKPKAAALVVDDHDGFSMGNGAAAALIASGVSLRSYAFDKYKSKKKDDKKQLASMTVMTTAAAAARKAFAPLESLCEGVHLARDLVNEPANILYPKECAKRTRQLTKVGVKVEILTETDLKKLKMDAILGVGQGSVRDSRIVVMQWMGGKKGEDPVAFVGKGV